MEFGRAEVKEILGIDHSLPADGRITGKLLKSEGRETPLKFHVGCGKWGRQEWNGHLYPEKTKDINFLTEYAKSFDTIELGATFFSVPDKENIDRWLDKVAQSGNKDFMFIPKVHRRISHIKKLEDCSDELHEFLTAVDGFGAELGPILLQLSDNFGTKFYGRLESFVKALPKDYQFFIELRHQSWFSDEISSARVFELFHQYGIGSAMSDSSGRRDCLHMELPTPDLYVRFNGNSGEHRYHDEQRIDQWVERIGQWSATGLRNVYFIVHQFDEKDTPALAAYVIRKFNQKFDAGLRPVEWK